MTTVDARSDGERLDALHRNLTDIIGRLTVGEEDCSTLNPNLDLFRREAPTQPAACKVEPSIVLVVQGRKQLLIGDRAFVYDREHFLIHSLDIPGASQALEASPNTPCLGLVLKLDLRVLAELITQSPLPLPRDRATDGSSALGRLTPTLLEPFCRLLGLLDEPSSIGVLSPLIEREIHYRLLASENAARLWQIASVGSLNHRIARAVDWLKLNYAKSLRVEELAAHVQMSPSSFHQHFRQLTTMSPLQYQKWLRLHEARRMMLNDDLDAASAGFTVGYESPSQFSREYARLFGAPPKRDIGALRRKAETTRFLGSDAPAAAARPERVGLS